MIRLARKVLKAMTQCTVVDIIGVGRKTNRPVKELIMELRACESVLIMSDQ